MITPYCYVAIGIHHGHVLSQMTVASHTITATASGSTSSSSSTQAIGDATDVCDTHCLLCAT